jgi:hypothetical protein
MKKLKLKLIPKAKKIFITKLRKSRFKPIMTLNMQHIKQLLLTKRKLKLIKLPKKLTNQMHQSTLRLKLRNRLTLLPKLIKRPQMHRLKLMLLPPKLLKLKFQTTSYLLRLLPRRTLLILLKQKLNTKIKKLKLKKLSLITLKFTKLLFNKKQNLLNQDILLLLLSLMLIKLTTKPKTTPNKPTLPLNIKTLLYKKLRIFK